MPFLNELNQKQHLSLSTLAYETITGDMFTFKAETLSGFINTIFFNYRLDANASLSLTLKKYSDQLKDSLKDENNKDRIIKVLTNQKQTELVKNIGSYPRDYQFKIWLNIENLQYLSEPYSECGEEKYYSSRGKYIKAVLEEYARLPYVKRELIYYKDLTSKIDTAVAGKYQLRIETSSGKVFSVYPSTIMTDPLFTTNYLVGFCKPYDQPDFPKNPCSFKLAGINNVRIEKSKSGVITAAEKNILSEKIKERGVQFMAGAENTIKIRLSEAGVYKYNRFIHLRPMYTEINDDIYTFSCTEAQAEFYFFKFGKDAEVLQPESLREKFIKLYNEATNVYNKQSRE